MLNSFLVDIIRQLLRQALACGNQKNTQHNQEDPNDPLPNAQPGVMQPVIEEVEGDFNYAKQDQAGGDEPDESADDALHAATDGFACASKSAFTDGRINTIRVKTPRTVPNGMNMHATPAATQQRV